MGPWTGGADQIAARPNLLIYISCIILSKLIKLMRGRAVGRKGKGFESFASTLRVPHSKSKVNIDGVCDLVGE
jgi:hypothetical protein